MQRWEMFAKYIFANVTSFTKFTKILYCEHSRAYIHEVLKLTFAVNVEQFVCHYVFSLRWQTSPTKVGCPALAYH